MSVVAFRGMGCAASRPAAGATGAPQSAEDPLPASHAAGSQLKPDVPTEERFNQLQTGEGDANEGGGTDDRGSDYTGTDYTGTEYSGSDDGRSEAGRSDDGRSNDGRSDDGRSDDGRSDAGADDAGADDAGADDAGADDAGADDAGADDAGADDASGSTHLIEYDLRLLGARSSSAPFDERARAEYVAAVARALDRPASDVWLKVGGVIS